MGTRPDHAAAVRIFHQLRMTLADVAIGIATLMDAIRMNIRNGSTIGPILEDIVVNLATSGEDGDEVTFDGSAEIRRWLRLVKDMPPASSLNEHQVESILKDLDLAYGGIHELVWKGNKHL